MYSNLLQWRQIRKKILIDGKSIQSISKGTGISRNTIRKILKTESPPGYGGRKTQKEKKHSSIKTENSVLFVGTVDLLRVLSVRTNKMFSPSFT